MLGLLSPPTAVRQPRSTMPTATSSVFMIPMLLVLYCATSSTTAAATFQISPSTMQDSRGNSADNSSVITYRKLTTNATRIQCSGCVGDGGMRSVLNTANGFAHAVIAGDYPYKLISDIANNGAGKINIQKLVTPYTGLLVCVGIGVLFVVVFPVIGCFLACCRCCGRCAGSRRTDGNPKTGCWRPCYMVALLILTSLVCAGGGMIMSANGYISSGLHSLRDDTPANLDALTDFFSDTTKVIQDVSTVDLNFTRDVVFRDLKNIGAIMGRSVSDGIKQETQPAMDKLRVITGRMDTSLTELKDVLPKINTQIDTVKDGITQYSKVMTKISTDYSAAKIAGKPPLPASIDSSVDTSKLKTFDGTTQISNVGNLGKKIDDAWVKLDTIPDRVQTSSAKPVADLKASILDYTSSVADTTDSLDFGNKFKTDDVKNRVIEATDNAKTYEKYRSYGWQGIGGLVLFIAILFLLGLVFGMLGGDSSILPHQRGCASNSGGYFLIVGVAFTFLFGWILMLFTTVQFVIGTVGEDFGCVPLKDTTILDKLIDNYDVLGSGKGNYLGRKILGDSNKTMTVTEILSACQRNEAIYKAFRVNESDLFNISQIMDYKSKFSVKDDLSKVSAKVKFDDIKILTPDLKTKLKEFKNSIQYDFNTYAVELKKDPTEQVISFRESLTKASATASSTAKAVLTKTVNQIDNAVNKEGAALKASLTELQNQIDNLSAVLKPPSPKPSMTDDIASLQTVMKELDDKLPLAGKDSLNKATKSFADRIFGIVDSYINRLLYNLDNNIGQCRPVWDIYNTIVVETVCGTLVASLNGFWFALGWSLFFLMPAIVVALKLANHFLTMRLDNFYSESEEPYYASEPMEMEKLPDARGHPMFATNRVSPVDTRFRAREGKGL